MSHPLQITHSRWCEMRGSAKFKQQGEGTDGVRDTILPVQTRSHRRVGMLPPLHTTTSKRVLPLQNLRKRQLWRGAFCPCPKTAAILQQPIRRAATESGSGGGARVWPAPATRCHQLLDQRRSDPKMRLCQPCLSLTGTTVTRTTHRTRKDRRFPLQNRVLFVPVQVSLDNSCVWSLRQPDALQKKKTQPNCEV